MQSTMLNGHFEVSYPNGFHVLDAEEQQRVFLQETPDRWAIRDEKLHILFTVQWHRSNAMLVKVASAKDQAKRIGKAARKAYAKQGFSGGEPFRTEFCGQSTWGVRFQHQVDGVVQDVEAVVAKHEDCMYMAYTYRRDGASDRVRKACDAITCRIVP